MINIPLRNKLLRDSHKTSTEATSYLQDHPKIPCKPPTATQPGNITVIRERDAQLAANASTSIFMLITEHDDGTTRRQPFLDWSAAKAAQKRAHERGHATSILIAQLNYWAEVDLT
ncbi:hypothetical protein FYJ24_09470 [Actinomycetaceae bacterium WB03_NA08]|uniref:Uncharacterized protein n=1 Tax=Scrofimicrobium canadense TaxID=2652290 RepID=A0A6N7WA14_9ACTO|nr:hypothetical protein [Scrofimicrobium canadense]MSS84988.1 hypothetical protein [Scrofimicrobium canadense]